MIDELTLSRLLEEGYQFLEQGKLLHALQVYRRIVTLAPDSTLAWIQLSSIHSDLKNDRAAEEALQNALITSPQPKEILVLIGDFHLHHGRASRALFFYKKAIVDEDVLSRQSRCRLHFNLGRLYRKRGQEKLAEYHLRRTRSLDPTYPRVNELLAEILLKRNAIAESIRILTQCLENNPYSSPAHLLLGRAYGISRQWQKAFDEFVSGVDMDPDNAQGWQLCGEALLSLRRLDEAEQYLKKSLELNPHQSDAVADLGNLWLRRNHPDRALSYFDKVLKKEPTNKKALLGKQKLRKLYGASVPR